jgi:hypothetical protein
MYHWSTETPSKALALSNSIVRKGQTLVAGNRIGQEFRKCSFAQSKKKLSKQFTLYWDELILGLPGLAVKRKNRGLCAQTPMRALCWTPAYLRMYICR